MKTYLEIATDGTKSTFEREMASILCGDSSKEESIKKHADVCKIDESESSEYYESVMESLYE
jgi:hypothetical protein